MKKSGFTVIELLVVIAMIAIFATLVLVSLNAARTKARDAGRVAALQEMAKLITLNDADPAATFWSSANGTTPACTAANSDIRGCLAIGKTGASVATHFDKYLDPSSTVTTACSSATTKATAPCQYSIAYIDNAGGAAGPNPNSQHFEICSWLEVGTPQLQSGLVHIGSDTGGSVKQGCY